MNLANYLKNFPESQHLTVIGPFLTEKIEWVEPIIFVDRGVQFREDQHLGFSVGDGDSSSENLDELLSPDKDFSDLAYVLRNIPEHFKLIHLLGFLGGRRDHELINLGEVHHFLKNKSQTSVHFDRDQVLVKSAGEWSFSHQGLFSLFAFESTKVTLNGDCTYKLNPQSTLTPHSSHGLSNLAQGTVHFMTTQPLFVFKEI